MKYMTQVRKFGSRAALGVTALTASAMSFKTGSNFSSEFFGINFLEFLVCTTLFVGLSKNRALNGVTRLKCNWVEFDTPDEWFNLPDGSIRAINPFHGTT